MTIDLDALTDADRRDLHTRLSYMLAQKNGAVREFSQRDVMVWGVIGQAIPELRYIKLATFVERHGYRKYQECCEQLLAMVDDAMPPVVRRHVREQVRVNVIRCLADYLRGVGAPVTPMTLFSNLDKLEHAVNLQFPGYMAAGLLHRVVKIAA